MKIKQKQVNKILGPLWAGGKTNAKQLRLMEKMERDIEKKEKLEEQNDKTPN